METNDGQELKFEVVGIVEDDENNGYAVCYCEPADEFVVTDDSGKLLEDEALAQEILDDFFVLAEESQDGEEPSEHDHAEHDHAEHDHAEHDQAEHDHPHPH